MDTSPEVIRVSFVAPQSISLVIGGVRTQIMETARHLPDYDIEVDFYTPWETFDTGRYDLCHIFHADMESYPIARTLAEFGIPFVVSPIIYSNHTPIYIRSARLMEKTMGWLGRGIWTDYSIISSICNLATLVTPNTRSEGNLIHKGFGIPRRKIDTIPNGVEERFKNADPGEFVNRYEIENFILTVGNIGSTRKNILNLIKAAGGLNTDLVVIGKVFNNQYAEQCLRESRKYDNVHILDPVDHESSLLASAYAACEVFTLPSKYETPGIAALEAGLAGAKVVITERGGTKEYFQDMAVYVDPESVQSIREGILNALDNRSNHQLREHIRSNYLWDHVARKTAEVYKKIADQ